MTKWEYKRVEILAINWMGTGFERKGKTYDNAKHYINSLGLEGWELVSVCGYDEENDYHYLYFKRQIE